MGFVICHGQIKSEAKDMQVLRKLKLPNSLRAKMLLWAFVFVVPILAILYATIWTAAESFETQTRGSINQTLTPYSADIDATLDRKSTRLNSSHVSSSYAVFCLKKK